MAYSLFSSMSLAFWFTTRTGSVNRVPPPMPGAPVWAPALATSAWTFSVGRLTVGTFDSPPGGSTDCRPWDATCSVHRVPSKYRSSCRP